MVTKEVSIAVACAMLLLSSGGSLADEYHPGQFFSLDLPNAVLSPKPFGPPTEFKPAPSDVAVDRASDGAKASTEPSMEPGAEASTEPKVVASKPATSKAATSKALASVASRAGASKTLAPKRVASKAMASKAMASKVAASKTEPGIAVRKVRVAHLPIEKPHGAARTKVARRHTNPLDAQALDTRIQVWPCRSGGICDWKR